MCRLSARAHSNMYPVPELVEADSSVYSFVNVFMLSQIAASPVQFHLAMLASCRRILPAWLACARPLSPLLYSLMFLFLCANRSFSPAVDK